MKILVTGATGMVGRHVVEHLVATRHDVVVLTRDVNNVKSLPWSKQVRCEIAAIEDFDRDRMKALGSVDLCMHLAWGHLDNFRSMSHIRDEVQKSYDFVERLARNGIDRILVTGTCLEYGLQCGELDETTNPAPSLNYAIAKDSLHRFLRQLEHDASLQIVWARLFYMFGEGQNPRSLLPQLDAAIKRGDRRFAMSGGEQLRDYLCVGEVARRLCHLAIDTPNAGTVNVCSGKPISVRRLVEERCREQGSDIELDLGHYPYPDYEPLAFWGNPAKMNSLLTTS